MGIVKIVSGELAEKNGYRCRDEDLTRDDRMLLQSFPSHEFDDCESAEVDCELAMSRGKMCNVPYGLYDLPELTEVLSLETWNLCLTEDDRFRLAAYLPDMDQHEFLTTMKDLLSGDAMLFGSPVRSFFLRLNSGFYSPEVSQARELLMTFQRRRHYHFLKLYHDGLVGKIASMDKLLKSSDTNASLGEMVPDKLLKSSDKSANLGEMAPILHSRGYGKHFPVGLSSSTLPIITKGEADTFSPLKRAKLMDGTSSTHCSTRHNETVLIAHHPNEPRQNCSKLPKGVLKIRNGCASLTDGSEGIHHKPRLILVDRLEMQSSSFCTPPHAFAHDVHGSAESSSSHINKIRSTSGCSQSSPLQWKCAPETYAPMAKSPLGVQMTVPEELRGFHKPAANHSLAYSSEVYDTREFPHEKNLLKNFGRQNIIVHGNSPDLYTRVSAGHQMNEYKTMHSLRNPESTSEMLNLSTRIYPPYDNFSEQLETMRKYHDRLKLKTLPVMPVTGVEQAHRFPYTYSRRKLRKSLDIVDSIKASTMAEDTVSQSVLASTANMKAKALKL